MKRDSKTSLAPLNYSSSLNTIHSSKGLPTIQEQQPARLDAASDIQQRIQKKIKIRRGSKPNIQTQHCEESNTTLEAIEKVQPVTPPENNEEKINILNDVTNWVDQVWDTSPSVQAAKIQSSYIFNSHEELKEELLKESSIIFHQYSGKQNTLSLEQVLQEKLQLIINKRKSQKSCKNRQQKLLQCLDDRLIQLKFGLRE